MKLTKTGEKVINRIKCKRGEGYSLGSCILFRALSDVAGRGHSDNDSNMDPVAREAMEWINNPDAGVVSLRECCADMDAGIKPWMVQDLVDKMLEENDTSGMRATPEDVLDAIRAACDTDPFKHDSKHNKSRQQVYAEVAYAKLTRDFVRINGVKAAEHLDTITPKEIRDYRTRGGKSNNILFDATKILEEVFGT